MPCISNDCVSDAYNIFDGATRIVGVLPGVGSFIGGGRVLLHGAALAGGVCAAGLVAISCLSKGLKQEKTQIIKEFNWARLENIGAGLAELIPGVKIAVDIYLNDKAALQWSSSDSEFEPNLPYVAAHLFGFLPLISTVIGCVRVITNSGLGICNGIACAVNKLFAKCAKQANQDYYLKKADYYDCFAWLNLKGIGYGTLEIFGLKAQAFLVYAYFERNMVNETTTNP